MFAQVYICQKHGDTIEYDKVPVIDDKNDEYYEVFVCKKCGTELNENPVYRVSTEEAEAEWHNYRSFDDIDDCF